MGIGMRSRSQGYMLGQLASDALGSLVEFQSPGELQRSYPDGVQELVMAGHVISLQASLKMIPRYLLFLPECW